MRADGAKAGPDAVLFPHEIERASPVPFSLIQDCFRFADMAFVSIL